MVKTCGKGHFAPEFLREYILPIVIVNNKYFIYISYMFH